MADCQCPRSFAGFRSVLGLVEVVVASRVRFCFISVSLLTPVVRKSMLRWLERLCLSGGRRSECWRPWRRGGERCWRGATPLSEEINFCVEFTQQVLHRRNISFS
ncbi:unnamed protein product [Ixodes pacificus]